MNKSEKEVLVKALPSYLDHLRKCYVKNPDSDKSKNPKSLIAKIYGIYTV